MNSDNYEQNQPLVNPYASQQENKNAEMQKLRMNKQRKWIYYIEERRREVQGHSETEIAQILHVHVSTISRDVKALKELSKRFVFVS